jgi:hypothetical protein
MRKTAIFVEGHTELVFVREYLLKSYAYQDISIECYTLFRDDSFNTTEYPYRDENASNFFQIINVGNDNAVLTRLLNREEYLWNVGFQRIIGLRDMYSKNYREDIAVSGVIDKQLNIDTIEAVDKTLQSKAKQPSKIDFCFAIMESESWILGFHNCFEKMNPQLTSAYIKEQLGFDLATIDPETTFFHPAKIMEKIYTLAGQNYNKSKGNTEAIMSVLENRDFSNLSNSGKCQSFRAFTEVVQR